MVHKLHGVKCMPTASGRRPAWQLIITKPALSSSLITVLDLALVLPSSGILNAKNPRSRLAYPHIPQYPRVSWRAWRYGWTERAPLVCTRYKTGWPLQGCDSCLPAGLIGHGVSFYPAGRPAMGQTQPTPSGSGAQMERKPPCPFCPRMLFWHDFAWSGRDPACVLGCMVQGDKRGVVPYILNTSQG